MNSGQPNDEIHIELCQNCRLHRWCTRHNEKKYNQIFQAVSQALLDTLGPSYKVLKNPNISKPRMGAFEVVYQNKDVFSKIKNGCFPDPKAIALKVKDIIENKPEEQKDNEKIVNEEKTEQKPKKAMKPMAVKIPDKDFSIPKYDIICPSPTKIHRAYNEGFTLAMEKTNEK